MDNWYRIENKAEDAEVYIYDEIGGWGVTAQSFLNDIKRVKGNIILHINSPGGDTLDGIAIYNLLKDHIGKVTVKIEGLAASIASIIAMAGDSIEMADNSLMMIHNPWAIAGGEVSDFEKMAEILTKVKSLLITTYQAKTSLTSEEISQMMDAETWLDAKEAKAKGFVDVITSSARIKNQYHKSYNSNKYKEWESLLNTPPLDEPSIALPQDKNNLEGENMNQVFNLLGVKTEEEAQAKIQALQASNKELDNQIKALKEDALRSEVAIAIANGQISEDQKEYAEKLILADRELYNGFIEQVKKVKDSIPPVVPAKVKIGENKAKSEGVTWEELLKDPEELANMKNSNPTEYQRLFDQYMEDNR